MGRALPLSFRRGDRGMTMDQALQTGAKASDTPRLCKTRNGFMNVSRRFLLGILVLGMQAGFASALEPVPALVNSSTGLPPRLSIAAAATPANASAGIASILPVGWTTLAPLPGGAADKNGPSCCCAPGQAGVIAGVGLYLVQPYFQDNLAFGEIVTGQSAKAVDIRQHMELAPLIWLGYLTDDGWGARARYWYFREGTNQAIERFSGIVESAAPLGLGVFAGNHGMNVTSELEMQLLDLEGLADCRAGQWDFLFSTGLRLLRTHQTYNAYGQFALLSGHSFEGIGPTLALEARRFFGASGLALYGSVRGAEVFGSAHQQVAVLVENNAAADHRDRGMPIGELELGLEYGRQVGHAQLFGQIAFVGQAWGGAGNSSRSSTNLTPLGSFPGTGVSVDTDIALIGFSFRIGFNY
jgi:hypothetical protein